VFRLKDQGDKDKGDKDQGANNQGASDQGDEEPYELLYWRDDFDGPMQSA
jgi:hypothetical protein